MERLVDGHLLYKAVADSADMVAALKAAQSEHIREGSGNAAVEDSLLKKPHLLKAARELYRLRIDGLDFAEL